MVVLRGRVRTSCADSGSDAGPCSKSEPPHQGFQSEIEDGEEEQHCEGRVDGQAARVKVLRDEKGAHDADGCKEHKEKVAQYRIASAHLDLRSLGRPRGPRRIQWLKNAAATTSYCEASS